MFAKLKWLKNMQFECTNNQHLVLIDAPKEHGGDNLGPSPKELLLDSMMGCTAMDTKSLLTKMRQKIDSMELEIEAQKTENHPIHFKSTLIKFNLHGEGEEKKIITAVTKSLTKYCGVNYMISLSSDISYEVYFNDKKIHEGIAKFEINL